MKSIVSVIMDKCREHGITTEELSEKCGISENRLSILFARKAKIKGSELLAISNALDLNFSDFE